MINPNLQFAVQVIEALWEHFDRKYTSVTGIPTAWPDEASNHVNHLPHSHPDATIFLAPLNCLHKNN